MNRIVAIAMLVGCGGAKAVRHTFIRDVKVEGYQLALDRCEVIAKNDTIALGACTNQLVRLPMMVEPDDRATPGQISNEIASDVRDALLRCVATHRVTDTTQLRLRIGRNGRITTVETGSTEAGFLACASQAVAEVRFEPSQRSTLTLTLRGFAKAAP